MRRSLSWTKGGPLPSDLCRCAVGAESLSQALYSSPVRIGYSISCIMKPSYKCLRAPYQSHPLQAVMGEVIPLTGTFYGVDRSYRRSFCYVFGCVEQNDMRSVYRYFCPDAGTMLP